MVVETFKCPIVTQSAEPAIDRAPWRKAVRQKPPRTTCPQQIENGLDDLPHRPTPSPSALARRGQIRLDQMLFCIGKIASIAKLCAAMMRAGGRVPHDSFQGRCRNPPESYRNSAVHRYVSVLTQPLSAGQVLQTLAPLLMVWGANGAARTPRPACPVVIGRLNWSGRTLFTPVNQNNLALWRTLMKQTYGIMNRSQFGLGSGCRAVW